MSCSKSLEGICDILIKSAAEKQQNCLFWLHSGHLKRINEFPFFMNGYISSEGNAATGRFGRREECSKTRGATRVRSTVGSRPAGDVMPTMTSSRPL